MLKTLYHCTLNIDLRRVVHHTTLRIPLDSVQDSQLAKRIGRMLRVSPWLGTKRFIRGNQLSFFTLTLFSFVSPFLLIYLLTSIHHYVVQSFTIRWQARRWIRDSDRGLFPYRELPG